MRSLKTWISYPGGIAREPPVLGPAAHEFPTMAYLYKRAQQCLNFHLQQQPLTDYSRSWSFKRLVTMARKRDCTRKLVRTRVLGTGRNVEVRHWEKRKSSLPALGCIAYGPQVVIYTLEHCHESEAVITSVGDILEHANPSSSITISSIYSCRRKMLLLLPVKLSSAQDVHARHDIPISQAQRH
ncbi:uncharacterized protein BDZ83DRAFT_646914 [Colletotrichum acutatum]|uniref:Uncharacterized protein n=1 Tax=Glomerella acutata TaxID=27357 RepID=A0AAD8XND7_GLOAC|nr:uncharacterized protein BDZ83DRAFT_646914 [Colletotrichum acutatum]KAK1730575.1 hypothetical protein BDZ83DRAFT_646914 [Colletotrichum acutatum]